MDKKTNNGFKNGHIPWSKGGNISEEHKRRISESMKGRKLSKEHKEKIGEAHKKETFLRKPGKE